MAGGSTFVRSRQYTLGAWVYATVASRGRIRAYDGTTTTQSSFHSGGSTWEWLTVTFTVGAAITILQVGGEIVTGNTSVYFDGFAITEGDHLEPGYYPQTTPFWSFPHRAVMAHDESIITVGNGFNYASAGALRYAFQSAAVDGDTFTHSFWAEEGIGYTFSVLGRTNSSHGRIDWYIDNIKVISLQDWYSAGQTEGVIKAVTSIAVIGTGYHVLKGVLNGKNASSSGENMLLVKYWITQSGD